MREIIPNVISEEEAKILRSHIGYKKFTDPIVSRIITLFPFDVDLTDPSYVRVEQRPRGHPWHTDAAKHMRWASYTARILLDEPTSFEGGGYYFRTDPETPVFAPRDLIVYSNDTPDNEHFVASHKGTRRVLLMFMKEM